MRGYLIWPEGEAFYLFFLKTRIYLHFLICVGIAQIARGDNPLSRSIFCAQFGVQHLEFGQGEVVGGRRIGEVGGGKG